jgi:hypothetical protein
LTRSRITFESEKDSIGRHRTAVSLHGHTLHSKESLSFIYKVAAKMGIVRWVVNRGHNHYRKVHGAELDLRRGWWTPPLAPRDAWLVEKQHAENTFGLKSLVSLTDHDNIEAGLTLRILDECRDMPVSVEWTIPYAETFFHVGVHNIPPASAREWMNRFAEFTANPSLNLTEILEEVSRAPETLVIFNHPCWDERGVGQDRHMQLSTQFAKQYGDFFHAFELNGLRNWQENMAADRMAREFGKTLVSGGDRHALEPNTILNLSSVSSFPEFIAEVKDGRSEILVTNPYMEPLGLRILASLEDVLRTHENHGRGWKEWSDRVFYSSEDGVVRPLTELFAGKVPTAVQTFVKGVHFIRQGALRHATRLAFPREQVTAP